MKLDAKALRGLSDETPPPVITRFPVYMILDNILDTYNIGGHFRLADALAVEKVYICGASEVPPHHRIAKASVGTYKVVPWEYCKTAVEAISEVRSQWSELRDQRRTELLTTDNKNRNSDLEGGRARGAPIQPQRSEDLFGAVRGHALPNQVKVVAIEQHPKAVPYTKFEYSLPLALVVGHETDGISKAALDASDAVVEIPMHGVNKSLNVIISAAIVGFHAYDRLGIRR